MLSKLLFFLSPKEKLLAAGVFLLMFVGAILEATGIAVIFPLIALISNPAAVQEFAVLRGLYEFSGVDSTDKFLIWMVGVVFAFYVFKYIYLGLLSYTVFWFIFKLQISLSTRLLGAYLHSPYPFHLQKNSAELLRNTSTDVLLIFSGVLVPGFSVVIEVLVVGITLLILIYTAPLATLGAMTIIGGSSAAFYLFIRKRAAKIGAVQQEKHAEMIKWVNQGLGGVKEIKILGREDYFLRAYRENSIGYGRSMRYLRTFSDLPRFLIEALVLASILLVIGVMLYLKQDMQTLLPTLGLFAMAAVRLMPSMNRILSGLTAIRYYSPSADRVYEDLKELEDVPTIGTDKTIIADFPFEKSIELENISFQYAGTEKPVLQNINLTIPKGQSIAFIGSSGAGKTTIVDVILGLLESGSGTVKVDGVNIQNNLVGWQRKVGYIPQPVYLSDDTIRRNVAFGIDDDKIEDEQIWEALRAAQLEDFVRGLPEQLDTLVGEHGVRISGGQRQRIGIARALYHNPEVLILDEATAALDNETEREVTEAIDALSGTKTIIAIAHRLTTVKDFDCLFYMKDGSIVDSATFDDLLERNQEFQKMANPQIPRKETSLASQ